LPKETIALRKRKWDFLKIIHSVKKQFSEYIIDSSDEYED
jgi:hypothetical protein